MNWKKILTGTAVFACAAALLTGCGGDKASAPDKGADKSKIVVGLDDNFPPMGFKNEKNEIVGFDVDLAKEAAKRLGREVEFKAIDWSSKEAELKSGRVQILWNGLDITEKRKENMLFSNPYMDNRQIIFVKKGSTAVSDEKSLAGKTIGVQTGTAQEDYATELSEQCVADGKDKITIMPHDLQTDITTKVIGGQYDATFADSTVIGYTTNLSGGKIEQVGDVVESAPQGVAVNKNDEQLTQAIQKAMQYLMDNGDLADILDSYGAKEAALTTAELNPATTD